MPVQFRPISDVSGGEFGAEVVGIDPRLRVDDDTFRAIEAAWYRHSILLFRGLDMGVEDHIGFTRRLGVLHLMPVPEHNLDGHPEIFVVGNARKEDGTALGLRGADAPWRPRALAKHGGFTAVGGFEFEICWLGHAPGISSTLIHVNEIDI